MQYAPGSGDQFEEWEIELIGREASGFSRRRRLRWSEADDLKNAGREAWWRERHRWDPVQSAAPTYLRLVVRRTFEDIAKAEGSQGRAAARTAVSIDVPILEGDESLIEFLADPDVPPIDIALDLQRVVGGLSERQKAIVRGRLAGYETGAMATHLGVHRDTVNEDLKRIRVVFRDAGLGESELRSGS
ncbi:MAG: hypothetical protein LC118_19735 [Dehalococcoidia bacterium]|nr:hypothetical protein [Dehalococcoidia bacterium]